MKAIFTGFLTSAAISVVLFGIVAFFYMRDVPGGWWRPFLSTTVGVALAIVIDRLTDYFTGSHDKPVTGDCEEHGAVVRRQRFCPVCPKGMNQVFGIWWLLPPQLARPF